MDRSIPEMSVTELRDRLEQGDPLTIVDVREPHEWAIGNLEKYGAHLIPMGELVGRLAEIPRSDEVVLVCRSGNRSGRVLEFLRSQGYDRLWNLKGGMLAWSDQIDPSIPKY